MSSSSIATGASQHIAIAVICRGSVSLIRSAGRPWRPVSLSSRRGSIHARGISWRWRFRCSSTGERDKWGTVRVAISLQGMYGEIQRTRLTILSLRYRCRHGGVSRRVDLGTADYLTTRAIASRGIGGGGRRPETSHRCPGSGDEIGELATTFNRMTNDLQGQQAALQEANRELDAQLREVSNLERYNARVLASMTNGLVTLNMEGRIVKWNDMAARITGYRSRRGRGATLSGILCE